MHQQEIAVQVEELRPPKKTDEIISLDSILQDFGQEDIVQNIATQTLFGQSTDSAVPSVLHQLILQPGDSGSKIY